LKYIIKDGSAAWLHILSSPCFVRVSCTLQSVTFCTVHDTHSIISIIDDLKALISN